MTHGTTFRQRESQKGQEIFASSGNSPLEAWYRAIRDERVEDFTPGDLSRAIRQQLFPETVVPVAIETLKKDPLAGEMYDGELLLALDSVPKPYWTAHPAQASAVVSLAELQLELVDTDLRPKLRALRESLQRALGQAGV